MRMHFSKFAALPVLAVMCAAPAQAMQTAYDNSFTLSTMDQSLWSTGAQASWSYDSGFIGGSWGTYANKPAVSFGLDGIVGSANVQITPAVPPVLLLPAIPAVYSPTIPAVYSPAIPAVYSPYIPPVYSPAIPAVYARICNPFNSSDCWNGPQITPAIPSKQITPAIPSKLITPAIPPKLITPEIPPQLIKPYTPAVYSPEIPAVYGDTRTGGSAAVESSGRLGFSVQAGANGGGLDLSLPYQATLLAPARDEFVAGKLLRIESSGQLKSGALMAVDAPSLNASIKGIIDTNNALKGTGCLIPLGCTSGSTPANLHETFSIIDFDTTKPKPLTALDGLLTLPVVLGQDLPITVGIKGLDPQGKEITIGSQTVGHVTLNAPSDRVGGTVSGDKVELSTNQTILRTTADFGGIAQAALGVPGDVLQPSLDVGVVSIGGTLINLQGGINLGMSQLLSFDAKVKVNLSFDQLVYDGAGIELGKDVSFDLGGGIDLMFKDRPTSLKYSFSMGADSLFTNDTGISVDPLFAIKAGCFNLSVAGGVLADIEECAFDKEYATTDLLRASVYKKSFAVEGFNSASFEVTLVPEPQTWALLIAGLGFVGFKARRRG